MNEERLYTEKEKSRFFNKIVKNSTTKCWEWTGAKGGGKKKQEYGRLRLRTKLKCAHRVSYTTFRGNIPNDKIIDHICENKLCVNPDHLAVVDYTTNTSRAIDKSKTSSRYIGVSYHKGKQKWEAHLTINTEVKFLGTFITEEEAYKARLDAEKTYL